MGSTVKSHCAISIYTMGFYLMPEEIHHGMDTNRADFYWHGLSKYKKYDMVKWEALSMPKEYGGLGFTETRTMNRCLLAKWIFKLENEDESTLHNVAKKEVFAGWRFFW